MRKREYDFWLLFSILSLMAIGIVMVFSASSYYALHEFGNKYQIFIRQTIWAIIGIIAMFVVSKLDYRRIAQASPIFLAISILLLIMVLIPGIGKSLNGSRRWFNLGFTTFQPSEFSKLAMILFFAFSLSKNGDKLKYFFTGLLPYLVVIGIHDFLLYKEPHMSCIILITLVSVIMLFCAGARIRHFLAMAVPAAVLGWQLLIGHDYREERLLSFMDPFKYKQGSGFQVVNSLYAIASGSVFGRGLGKSIQKYLYIPEPHNDFIFAIIAEELGFVGALTVIVLFMLFIWRGIKIAMNAPDMMGSLIAIGMTSLIAAEAIINIAVVTSTLPVTGMPLPFISSGGTSLVFMLAGMGVLLNISKSSSSTSVRSLNNKDDLALKRII